MSSDNWNSVGQSVGGDIDTDVGREDGMEAGKTKDHHSQRLRLEARWLLNHFADLLRQKHEQEARMANPRLYTREDAMYKLSGLAAHEGNGNKVQSSNLMNAPLNTLLNVDRILEQMNAEVVKEDAEGYLELCEKVAMVNAAIMVMDPETRNAARQMFVKGVAIDRILGLDGDVLCRTKVFELRSRAETVLTDVLSKTKGVEFWHNRYLDNNSETVVIDKNSALDGQRVQKTQIAQMEMITGGIGNVNTHDENKEECVMKSGVNSMRSASRWNTSNCNNPDSSMTVVVVDISIEKVQVIRRDPDGLSKLKEWLEMADLVTEWVER